MKRLMVAAVIAAVSLSVGCLECPEGTVKCTISRIVIDVDAENQSLSVRRARFKTCVTPDACPGHTIEDFDPGSVGSGIDYLALQLAAVTGTFDREALRIDVDSRVGPLGRVKAAEVTVRAARLGADGDVLRQLQYSGPLELVEERADGWTFIPAADPELGDHVAAIARLAVSTAPDEQFSVDYEVTLKLDRAPGALGKDDIETEVRLAGQKL